MRFDDAPLEERRARAVEMRRTLPAQLAGEVGASILRQLRRYSGSPGPSCAIRKLQLHDALLTLLWLPVEEAQDWAIHLPRLIEEGRAVNSM